MASKKITPDMVEINIIYSMQTAMQMMIRDIEKRMLLKRETLSQQRKQRFKNLMLDIKRVKLSEDKFDEDILGVTKTIQDYTYWQEDASDLARLIILYIEKCDMREHNKALLFKTLTEMDGNNVFNQGDIDRFRLRGLPK